MLTPSNSPVTPEPQIGKIRIISQDKTAPHSTAQTVEEFGFRIITINASQKVKPAIIVDF